MRQLLLDLDSVIPPSLDTFVVGQNAELAQVLCLFSERTPSQYGERSVYLWGEAGAGKTHLLHALAQVPHSRYISANAPEEQFWYSPEVDLYLLDDCEHLPPASQIDAFALFNEARANGAFFVAAGNHPPMILNLRDDLRTRLGWGLIYQVIGLSDEDKIDALERAAQAQGIGLAPGVLAYLITHYRRDMRSLSVMLGELDHYSLETKRPITLPLLRELLQRQSAA
ncbi:MAG: DnaA regulatory inactivator Hda [Burkholderiales bacterium]|nr:DnaA regulatory inactivator Hda [Burkholderiales bacterium]